MKISEIRKVLDSKQDVFEVEIPSTKEKKSMKSFTVGDRKQIARISLNDDEYNVEYQLAKLALIDKCSNGEIDISKITDIDYISILAAIRLNNFIKPLEFTLKCLNCEKSFTYRLDFGEIIEKCDKFIFQEYNLITKKKEDIYFKIKVKDCKIIDHISFYGYLTSLKNLVNDEEELEKRISEAFYYIYPILFIDEIYLKEDKIEDFQDLTLAEKIEFIDENLPTLDLEKLQEFGEINIETESNLYDFVLNKFPIDRLDKLMPEVICPKCKNKVEGVFTYDSFFIE